MAQPTTRRDELLKLAASMFAERGLRATTVRDIADGAAKRRSSIKHSGDDTVGTIAISGDESAESSRRRAARHDMHARLRRRIGDTHREGVADGITVKLQRVGGITRAALIRDVALRLDMSERQLERRCRPCFGLSPKGVLRRSRFLDMAAAIAVIGMHFVIFIGSTHGIPIGIKRLWNGDWTGARAALKVDLNDTWTWNGTDWERVRTGRTPITAIDHGFSRALGWARSRPLPCRVAACRANPLR